MGCWPELTPIESVYWSCTDDHRLTGIGNDYINFTVFLLDNLSGSSVVFFVGRSDPDEMYILGVFGDELGKSVASVKIGVSDTSKDDVVRVGGEFSNESESDSTSCTSHCSSAVAP